MSYNLSKNNFKEKESKLNSNDEIKKIKDDINDKNNIKLNSNNKIKNN